MQARCTQSEERVRSNAKLVKPQVVEEGAEFVNATDPILNALCDTFKLPLAKIPSCSGLDAAVRIDERLLAQLTWLTSSHEADAFALKLASFEFSNNNCVDVSKQSYLGLLSAVEAAAVDPGYGGHTGYWDFFETHRIANGNVQLAQRLAKAVGDGRVHLTAPITKIDLSGPGVTVSTANGSGTFDAVILATPPTVWHKITFAGLSVDLAGYQVQTGPAIKHVAALTSRFWDDPPKQAPIGIDNLLGMVWAPTSTPKPSRGFAMSAFASGSLADQTAIELEAGISALFPRYAPKSTAFVQWQFEDYIKTGYSCPGPSEVCSKLRRLVEEPVDAKLYFAGEHSSPGWFGFMEGALESGVRAANLILGTSA